MNTAALRGQSPAQLAALVADRVPAALSLVLVIALGYSLARTFWLLAAPGDATTWQPPPAPTAGTGTPVATGTDYRKIAAAHLFGRAAADDAPLDGDAAANAPDTSLNLQLRGAIAAGDSRFSHAIIADSGGTEKVYFVNDPLPGGATLQRVEADRVLLRRGGAVEVLRLPKISQGGGGGGVAQAIAAPRPVAQTTQQDVQQMIQDNAATFLDVVRPQPFMPNGQLKGYRVYPGPQRQQFAALGLRPGDLVTEINGVTLNNPAQGMEVFRSLGNASQVTVTVERDGLPQVLNLSMNEVNSLSGATQ